MPTNRTLLTIRRGKIERLFAKGRTDENVENQSFLVHIISLTRWNEAEEESQKVDGKVKLLQ